MSTKIGHFEIQSELAKSATGAVYKASDPQSGQIVALKAINLASFGEHAAELEKCLLAEAESTKVLSHPSLPPVFGAGEIDGQFCAAMEYIQGNSIATMLARKEGFSIWDILDIGRQVCSGLDHARSHNIFHYSLEPSKIMCGWDGSVRILGYGVSSVGKFAAQIPDVLTILNYMSPEQVRGEDIDTRSNLFSLGAMLYEMTTDCKAFEGEDAASVRESILADTPAPPSQLNPKLHPVLSDLIMKTLAKDPAERYQNAKELLDDLEQCKESKPLAAKAAAPAQVASAAATQVPAPKPPQAVSPAKPSVASGAGAAAAVKPAAAVKTAAVPPSAPSRPAAKQPVPGQPVAKKIPAPPLVPGKVSTAAVATAAQPSPVAAKPVTAKPAIPKPPTPAATRAQASGSAAAAGVKSAIPAAAQVPSAASSTVLSDPPVAPPAPAPKIAVDPLMAEDPPAASRVSFSEMTELPPLDEDYVPASQLSSAYHNPGLQSVAPPVEDEKPKIQPQEVAANALMEIKNVPPRLMVYSMAGAAVIILIIAVALVLHVNKLNDEGETPRASSSETATPAAPGQTFAPVPPTPVQSEPAATETEESAPEETSAPPHAAAVLPKSRRGAKKSAAPVAPAILPGQMAIDSTPQGAQVQIDGKTDPSWVTPFTLPGLTPGPHSVVVSKAGYVSDTRSVEVSSGGKSFVVTHLTQLMATLAVSSSPAGANVFVDGKDIGKLTPAQVSVDKGQHVVLVRKQGFLDETTNAQFTLGQTFSFSPTLRPLGNVDDIKTVGKMNKLFGRKEAQTLGTISIKTQPKGAQIAVNQHMLDKSSPVEVELDPGNYIVDITLTGYAPIHKVISVDKGGKVVVDEVMQRQ
jgi:Protein kinase domain/PEGA domain